MCTYVYCSTAGSQYSFEGWASALAKLLQNRGHFMADLAADTVVSRLSRTTKRTAGSHVTARGLPGRRRGLLPRGRHTVLEQRIVHVLKLRGRVGVVQHAPEVLSRNHSRQREAYHSLDLPESEIAVHDVGRDCGQGEKATTKRRECLCISSLVHERACSGASGTALESK